MKTITFSALLLVITISLSSFVVSHQANVPVKVSKAPGILRVHRQGSAISLTWSNSATAVGYRIERGDGEFFDIISDMANDGGRTSSFKDTSFFPGIIYYRVVFLNADGTEDYSNTEVIKITQRG